MLEEWNNTGFFNTREGGKNNPNSSDGDEVRPDQSWEVLGMESDFFEILEILKKLKILIFQKMIFSVCFFDLQTL